MSVYLLLCASSQTKQIHETTNILYVVHICVQYYTIYQNTNSIPWELDSTRNYPMSTISPMLNTVFTTSF